MPLTTDYTQGTRETSVVLRQISSIQEKYVPHPVFVSFFDRSFVIKNYNTSSHTVLYR